MRWRDWKLTRQPGRLWSPSHASTQPCTATLLRALQLAVVSDHEGLLRAENARRHLRIPSASFVNRWDDVTGLSCAVTYKGCVMRLSAGVADWHTVGWSQPADILCFACTDKEKKRLKTCQHLKIENALLKLQLLVNSVTERVLCSELTTLGKFVRSHTWCFL